MEDGTEEEYNTGCRKETRDVSTTRKTARMEWVVARQGLWNPVKLGSNPVKLGTSSGTEITGLLRRIPSIPPWASQPRAEWGWIRLNISRTFFPDGTGTQNSPINLKHSKCMLGAIAERDILKCKKGNWWLLVWGREWETMEITNLMWINSKDWN